MKKILLGLLLALIAGPVFAQATYPTPAGSRVNGVVPLACDAAGANCAPGAGAAGTAAADNLSASTVAGTDRSLNYVFDGAAWDRAIAVTTAGGAAQGTVIMPTTSSGAAITASFRTDAGANLSAKTSAGNLYDWSVTTGGTAGYVLVYNRNTAPPEGSVTGNGMIDCVAVAANSTVSRAYTIPEFFTVGLWINFSSTGCFTQTTSATAFIRARVQ